MLQGAGHYLVCFGGQGFTCVGTHVAEQDASFAVDAPSALALTEATYHGTFCLKLCCLQYGSNLKRKLHFCAPVPLERCQVKL